MPGPWLDIQTRSAHPPAYPRDQGNLTKDFDDLIKKRLEYISFLKRPSSRSLHSSSWRPASYPYQHGEAVPRVLPHSPTPCQDTEPHMPQELCFNKRQTPNLSCHQATTDFHPVPLPWTESVMKTPSVRRKPRAPSPPPAPRIPRLKTPDLEPLSLHAPFCSCCIQESASPEDEEYTRSRKKMDSQGKCAPSLREGDDSHQNSTRCIGVYASEKTRRTFDEQDLMRESVTSASPYLYVLHLHLSAL